MTDWDKSVDLLIVGSGGGGMVAALATLDAGFEPLIVEKQALVGGSTGLSGGIVWLPNNPLMRADGIADSHEDGMAYLADVVGDIGAPSSRAIAQSGSVAMAPPRTASAGESTSAPDFGFSIRPAATGRCSMPRRRWSRPADHNSKSNWLASIRIHMPSRSRSNRSIDGVHTDR